MSTNSLHKIYCPYSLLSTPFNMLTSGTVVCLYMLQVLKVFGTDKVISETHRLMTAQESLILVSYIKCTAMQLLRKSVGRLQQQKDVHSVDYTVKFTANTSYCNCTREILYWLLLHMCAYMFPRT